MFNHILLPTDDSELSRKTVLKGIEFAQRIRARATVCHAASHNDLTQVYVASGAVSKKIGEKVELEFKERVD